MAAHRYTDDQFHVVFWSKVKKLGPKDCWPWTGNKRRDGYGKYKRLGKQYLAHRYALESTNGKLREGLLVCHTCDNPNCCNPNHLFSGTHLDNNRDSKEKGRNSYGEKRPLAKLTAEAVIEIRENPPVRYGEVTAMARRFGVSRAAIRNVTVRKTWNHVMV